MLGSLVSGLIVKLYVLMCTSTACTEEELGVSVQEADSMLHVATESDFLNLRKACLAKIVFL